VTGTIHFESEWSLSTSTGVDLWLDGVKWAKTNGVRVKTANRIEFRNTANTETLWYTETPTAKDADGNIVSCEYEVRRQGGPTALFITVRVPKTWIDTAVFPIVIDPTFTDGYGGDVTTAKDATINGNTAGTPTMTRRNYGGGDSLGCRAAENSRAILQFDLSSIPTGSTIEAGDDAILYMYHYVQGSASAFTATFYSIGVDNKTWIEGTGIGSAANASAGEPCYNALAADGAGGVTTAWHGSAGLSTSGEDYEASSIGSFAGDRADAVGTEYHAHLTKARVQNWFSETNTNYGILLIPTGNASADHQSLGSSDHATTGYRPKLVVVYTAAAAGGIMPKPIMINQSIIRSTVW
jgi:hypothetical protein